MVEHVVVALIVAGAVLWLIGRLLRQARGQEGPCGACSRRDVCAPGKPEHEGSCSGTSDPPA